MCRWVFGFSIRRVAGNGKLDACDDSCPLVKGVYCLVIELRCEAKLRIGALGRHTFPPGVYVYVGSAMKGVEQRIGRHKSSAKTLRWHVDYLLTRAEVVASIALPSESGVAECALAEAVSGCEGATIPVPRFGSSDCACSSHLFFFPDADAAWVIEELNMCVSGLGCVYPRTSEGHKRASGAGSRLGSVRQ